MTNFRTFSPHIGHRVPFFAASILLPLGLLCSCSIAAPADYFRINVVDADTGRGVPLVELKTTNDVKYITDSNGIVAVNDPELLGQKAYFSLKSHGYEYPKDGFGNRGTALNVTAGGQASIKIKRNNIAERLYRITGSGIYRDSVLTGAPVPIKSPLLNGLVMGQDTVHAVPYKGNIFWLWGDTNRPSYPLGNFFTSAATSVPPTKGGLNPSVGVDLTYWVDNEGFSKKMIPLGGNKPVWMGSLFTMADNTGQERLFGAYSRVESDSKTIESGLAVFNDEKAIFEKVAAYDTILRPSGRPFKAIVNGKPYLYFHPQLRTVGDYAHVTNPSGYEAYTCLKPGVKYDGPNTPLERDANGKLVYGWKVNTGIVGANEEKALVAAKKMAPDEAIFFYRDAETGATIEQKGGSVFWNDFRKRWIRIMGQNLGSSSVLGEIWFAEADTPTGPWGYARKIVSHDQYTFYNPTQHPFFDQEGGRQIYFEGTYTNTYSGNKERTPRYEYNQIMYRLTLDDPRLVLPVPVYRLKSGGYGLRDTVDANKQWDQIESLPFFGLPSTGDGKKGQIPVYAVPSADGPKGTVRLQLTAPANGRPLFYALSAQVPNGQKPNPDIVPLYEYTNSGNSARWYSTKADEQGDGIKRSEQPFVYVWRNPSSSLPLDVLTPQPFN
jgi:hypothetical protein